MEKLLEQSPVVTFSAGSVGTGSSGDGQDAGGSKQDDRQAPKPRGGGSGGTGAEAGAPSVMFPGWTRSERT